MQGVLDTTLCDSLSVNCDFLGVLQVEETKNEDWLQVRKAIFRKKAELL
jgi:hypothetical protein